MKNSAVETCQAFASTNQTCSSYNGFEWRRKYPSLDDVNYMNKQACGSSMCILKNATVPEQCSVGQSMTGTLYANWQSSFNSSRGLCVAYNVDWNNFDALQSFCNQLGSNGQFYAGRSFSPGRLTSKSDCEQIGSCSKYSVIFFNPIIYVS